MNKKKTLGIIGGMGPLATVDLFSRIVELTEAKSDAEHIHIIIDNYPQIPDRTKAILGGTKEPLAELCKSAKRLENAGVDFIIIPCNTSHAFIEDIQAAVNIPIINMVEEVSKHLSIKGVKKCGVLATDGVIKSGIYDKYLSEYGIDYVYPSTEGQKVVMDIIYNQVKAGNPLNLEKAYVEFSAMKESGVETFILACTELPIAFKEASQNYSFVDCTDVLAIAAIKYAGYQVKDLSENI